MGNITRYLGVARVHVTAALQPRCSLPSRHGDAKSISSTIDAETRGYDRGQYESVKRPATVVDLFSPSKEARHAA